jgi:formyl-CoA transferase/CoA:oxalate CoA-transferase
MAATAPHPMIDTLRGVRVIDLTQNVAGPFCTQILGDLGADVIKIERPATGDDTRAWVPPAWNGCSSTFLSLNRNKKSVAVDLDTTAGQEIFHTLVRDADVVVHSLKPGSAEMRGLGFDTLRVVNPRLVYCAISAFGSKGPMAAQPGYDPLMQAYTGIMSVTGTEGDGPARVSVSLIDMGTGMWAAMGILAALRQVEQTGSGLKVEASLLETGVAWMTIFIANYRASGRLPAKMGTAMSMTAPYELFEAKDGAVFIAAGNDRLFAKVCTALDLPHLPQDPCFQTNADRVAHRAALHKAIAARTRELPVQEAVSRLQAQGAPCSVLNNVKDLLESEQVKCADIVHELPIETGDGHQVVGLPFTLDGERRREHVAPPALGAHTRETLSQAGFSAEQIDTFVVQRVIR